jgi:hypothetical protein
MARKRPAPPLPEELGSQSKQLFDVLNKSDELQCVLVSASFIDHCLASILRSHLVDGTTSLNLLQPGRALGEFTTRRQLCYCLGLITKGTSEDIGRIGRIRDLFAHKLFGMSFKHEEVVALCEGLHAEGFLEETNRNSWMQLDTRGRFSVAATIVVNRLRLDALSTQHRARKGSTTEASVETDGGPADSQT